MFLLVMTTVMLISVIWMNCKKNILVGPRYHGLCFAATAVVPFSQIYRYWFPLFFATSEFADTISFLPEEQRGI